MALDTAATTTSTTTSSATRNRRLRYDGKILAMVAMAMVSKR